MNHSSISRRAFTCAAAAAFAGFARAARSKVPIAVQLYSMRRMAAQDFPGAVAAVARIGYKGVEFAGFYNRTAPEVRKLLDDNGLKCCGSHTGIDALLGDAFERTVEFNRTIGNPFIVVPGLPAKYNSSRAAWLETAKLFDELSARLEPHKMRIGYHNHSREFQPLDGEFPWDTFCGHTRKQVVTQLDIGHAVHAGQDPAAVLKKYPGRALTVHVKEYSATKKDVLVGDGDVKWDEVFRACETVGKTQWYIVEQENQHFPDLAGVEDTFQRLKKMGK
ncbi:MAG TPA: sugar phosphate isomerase/epimerase [Bryobacteraceae bacterium]|nr:sugar phosphate isomerase/epimerase [Bryobacteraceae bacterium]